MTTRTEIVAALKAHGWTKDIGKAEDEHLYTRGQESLYLVFGPASRQVTSGRHIRPAGQGFSAFATRSRKLPHKGTTEAALTIITSEPVTP